MLENAFVSISVSVMKINKAPICELCSERIEGYGFLCLYVLELICKNTFENQALSYRESKTPKEVKTVIKFLESKGIVLTIEIDRTIVAVVPYVTGILEKEQRMYCWCRDRREL